LVFVKVRIFVHELPESLVGIAMGYWLDGCGLIQSFQTGCGVHPVSYAMGTHDLFLTVEAGGL
jgi:hypothetical protein